MKKVIIARGLPGSGKSTLMKREVAKLLANNMHASYVDIDIFHKQGYASALRDALYLTAHEERDEHYDWNCFSEDTVLYVDALCISQADISHLITEIVARLCNVQRTTNFEFTILDFEENREACKKNDAIRARANSSRSASTTIESARYEPIDLECLNEDVADIIANREDIRINCSVKLYIKPTNVWNIDKASKFERIKSLVYGVADAICHSNSNILYGESWITGGREWSYTGEEWSVGSEEPNDFDEFDNLLEAICPGISFLNYKKLRKECCSIYEYHVSDYYKSYDKSRWQCDLDKLAKSIYGLDINVDL